ncbi:MAG: OmpA/MotB domain protein [Symbiobacteriaceae bacterium]|jgi:chemotaxis protein MotB|nr:OmpA/MotB domain protein [Symbiobacteriaceae bacterium]
MTGKRKKAGGHGGGGHERWLLTYSDMITLLLALFILLYAMSTVDAEKYKSVAGALASVFGGGNGVVGDGVIGEGGTVPNAGNLTPEQIKEALEQIGQGLEADFASDGRFSVYMAERGLVISLAGNAFFDSGKAELRPEIIPLLNDIAGRLQGLSNDISLEGHTDSDPIRNAQFPSNWELSLARANTVRSYLEGQGVPAKQLIVVGYGETRPLFDNSTADGKQRNRRVDIVVLRDEHVIDLGQEITPAKP